MNVVKRLFTMEPALVRSLLVSLTSVAAVLVGHAVNTGWVDVVVNIYAIVATLVAGLLIRPAVWPNAKVARELAARSGS